MLETCAVKSFASGTGYSSLFVIRNMDCFTVGAHCHEAYETCSGKTDGMGFNGRNIKVIGCGVEEGHSWGIDSREEGAGVRLGMPVGSAIGMSHLGCSCVLEMSFLQNEEQDWGERGNIKKKDIESPIPAEKKKTVDPKTESVPVVRAEAEARVLKAAKMSRERTLQGWRGAG